MEAYLIIRSVGSFIPSPGTVPAESKSPSLTWNFELQLQYSGLHLHLILIIMLLAMFKENNDSFVPIIITANLLHPYERTPCCEGKLKHSVFHPK